MNNIKKNNIIISGVPRAGKSTISHMISKNMVINMSVWILL